jgi:hypothetical protein
MKIINAIENVNIIPLLYEKTGTKMHVLMSYHLLKGNAYKLTKEYRPMIDTLYLDSSAFSMSKGKFKMTVSEYLRYIRRYGSLFDYVFNLDDNFNNPDHNFNNQVFLEEKLSKVGLRPIPVIHDRANPFQEFEAYVKQGHEYIAIGSNSKLPDDVFKEIKEKYPEVNIHMFGSLNRNMLLNHKPYSADATTWAIQAGNGKIYYWDPIDEKDYLIYLGEREVKDKSIISFDNFHHKPELVSFLTEKFSYDRNDLLTRYEARRIVNLYFFKQLEDYINAN